MEIMDLTPGLVTPEDSKRVRSRVVVLGPGEEVGVHTSGTNEEVIVILEGKAAVMSGGTLQNAVLGQAVFIGQNETHNIVNNTNQAVKYIYIRSRSE